MLIWLSSGCAILLTPCFTLSGPTFTHALLVGGPAIDKGKPSDCLDGAGAALTTDQRGVTRPLDGEPNGSVICDVGAFEFDPSTPPPVTTTITYVYDPLYRLKEANYSDGRYFRYTPRGW